MPFWLKIGKKSRAEKPESAGVSPASPMPFAGVTPALPGEPCRGKSPGETPGDLAGEDACATSTQDLLVCLNDVGLEGGPGPAQSIDDCLGRRDELVGKNLIRRGNLRAHFILECQ